MSAKAASNRYGRRMTTSSRLVGLAALAAFALALASCGSSKPAAPAAPMPPPTIDVVGTLAVDTGNFEKADNECSGTGGYADINEGAQVVVYDAAGKQLALGTLQPGWSDGKGSCDFGFTVPSVPSGAGPYSVEISHRGKIAFTEDQANNVQVSLGAS